MSDPALAPQRCVPTFIGLDFAHSPDRSALAIVSPDGRAAPLSDDDAGLVTVMASALSIGVDPDNEPALLLALHRQRFEASAIARLAPLVADKLRGARRRALSRAARAHLPFACCVAFALLAWLTPGDMAQAAAALAPCGAPPAPTGWSFWSTFASLATIQAIGACVFVKLRPGMSEAAYLGETQETEEMLMLARCGEPLRLDDARFAAACRRAARDMRSGR